MRRGETVDTGRFQRCSKIYEWKIWNSLSNGRIHATMTVFQINVRGLRFINDINVFLVLAPSTLNKIWDYVGENTQSHACPIMAVLCFSEVHFRKAS